MGRTMEQEQRLTLTVGQAATRLGISKTSAYKQISEGAFPVPVLRLGKRLVVPTAPLMELLGAAA